MKVWDKVRYLRNTTNSDAIVWDEYYICDILRWCYKLTSKKGVHQLFMAVMEDDIELIEENTTKEYLVYIEWWKTPTIKHTKEEAEKEALRLTEKEKKKSYICKIVWWFEIEIKPFNI